MKVRYTHFNLGMGVVTVCHSVEEVESAPKNQRAYVRAGFSFCAPEDQFCRKTGRERAYRNLRIQTQKGRRTHKGAVYFWDYIEFQDLSIIEQSEAALNHYIDIYHKLLPKWIKNVLRYDSWNLSVRAKRLNKIMRKKSNVSAYENDKSGSTNCPPE